MSDIRLIDNGDGGEFVFNGIDLEIIEGFQNMPYIALFGGNIESNTGPVSEGELRSDWWGNSLLNTNQPSIQFNSDTERLFKNISLSSSSRLLIEQSIRKDLSFMSEFSQVESTASITGNERLEIYIKIQEPSNLQSNEFTYIWDMTRSELTIL